MTRGYVHVMGYTSGELLAGTDHENVHANTTSSTINHCFEREHESFSIIDAISTQLLICIYRNGGFNVPIEAY